MRGLRALGASSREIVAIRNQDRRAQGVNAGIERESRRAVAEATRAGGLTIVTTSAATSSAITDFIQPEFGGPGAANLLVQMPGKLAFFGSGAVIARLQTVAGSYWGGALPEEGYWGASADDRERIGIERHIRKLLGPWQRSIQIGLALSKAIRRPSAHANAFRRGRVPP